MKLFDNKVQELKYNVLREVATQTWKGYDAFSVFNEIANTLVKKDEPPQSCCIYKDRAIVADRIRLAIGGNKYNPNVVQVIDIACDECPEAGYVVTDMCRGCIAHSCRETCKLKANFIEGMGCTGGCTGGSGNLSQLKDAPRRIMEHSENAAESKILRNNLKPINII